MTARLTYAELLAERREYVAYTRKLNDEIAVMAVHRGRLLSALRRALLVIEDEVNIYAPEHCDAKRVSEARARHHAAGGTLAYYAAAISAARQAMNYDQRGAAAGNGRVIPTTVTPEKAGTQFAPHHPPEPQMTEVSGDYGQTGSGSARSDQPDAYLVVKRDTLSAQRTTFATLPGYSLAPGETLISETPLYAAPQMLIDQSRSTRGCQSAAGEIQMTPTERRVYRANVVVQTLKPLDDTCMKCDYDEAEGYLINHCNDCCRRIVTKLWRLRERVMRRRCGEERDRK